MVALHTSTIVFTFLAGCCWIIFAYPDYADFQGWPVGSAFRSDTSTLKVAGLMGLPGAPLAAWYLGGWESAITALIGGFFLAFVLTLTLRERVQSVAAIGLAASWFLGIILLAQA